MGNANGQVNSMRPSGKEILYPSIKPYVQGQLGENEQENQNNQNQKESDEKQDQTYISPLMSQTTQVAESRFTSDEISRIRKEFDKLSKDQVIGKRKLLEYFKLMEINDTYLTNELFFMIKNSSQINSPVDYNKFINFVSLIAKGSKSEKLQLLFSFFDKTPDAKISKEEVKAHISGTILSLSNIQFDDGGVEGLKQSICRAQESQIEAALDLFVEEIFSKYSSNQDELTYDEWSNWFLNLEGMKETLELKPNRQPKNQNQSYIGQGKQSNINVGGISGSRREKGYLEKTSSLNSSNINLK
ncbi:UNKNOWN [Stylonychia lemnae]|uniref:EF-hand domain-containing protein n=1 Tax=Stylonychia lemnae TaxID=5949 RepID=A0A077ZXZ4_STYLE|nr:UNKNOWN [Stylonychia lemnae]|eukprot:CDW73401.1 UNKNOWN [Stylonychia lemnae]